MLRLSETAAYLNEAKTYIQSFAHFTDVKILNNQRLEKAIL